MSASTSTTRKAGTLANGSHLDKLLAKYGANDDLGRLEKWGADKQVLVRHLTMLASVPSTRIQRKMLLGIDSRQARGLIATIRHVAGMMEKGGSITFWQPGTFSTYEPFLRRRAAHAISVTAWRKPWLEGFAEHLSKTPRDFHEETLLPCLLRDYADALEKYLAELQSLRKHPLRTVTLCHLIWHVKEKTHSYHDNEVSALVNAAENRPGNKDYHQFAHTRWRTRNEPLIARLGPLQFCPTIFPASIR